MFVQQLIRFFFAYRNMYINEKQNAYLIDVSAKATNF